MVNLGLLGAGIVIGISAIGSCLGIGYVGQAAIGAWKKCIIAGKKASMLMLVLVSIPITQIVYGFLLMEQMKTAAYANPENAGLYFGFGLTSGLAIGFSAIIQGKIGACAADSLGETGKGFARYIAVIAVVEIIAICVMILTTVSL